MFNLDGRPADPRAVGRMLNSMRHRGPDGQASFASGPAALGHSRLCATEESIREHQPLRDDAAQLAMVFDGRVDNREELKDALIARGMPPRDDTDAELVLRAYECWGDESAVRILGDFAYVIWDGKRQRLLCARDPLGVKPLYYHLGAKRFVCASELQALLLEPDFPVEPNEGMAAEALCMRVLDPEETLFQGIVQLVPGHYLTIDAGKVRIRRYWSLNSIADVRYSNDEQYASHFFDLFRDAVRCRMRHPGGGVAAQLSGGVDSSSVVSMAAFLQREGAFSESSLETFSLISPDPKEDESAYIDQVVSKWQLRATRQAPRPFNVSAAGAQVRQFNQLPDNANDTAMSSLYQQIQERGFRVMLTGIGGDDWFYGSTDYYAEAVRGLRVGSIVRRYRDDQRLKAIDPTTITAWHRLFRYGIAPAIPRPIRQATRSFRIPANYPPWLAPEFVRRSGLVERLSGMHWRGRSDEKPGERAAPMGLSYTMDILDRLGARHGIEVRHPLNDRRLVEFASAIPDEQRRRGTWQRYVMLQAMSELLPATIQRRTDKANFDWSFSAAIRDKEFGRVLEAPRMAAAGWIDAGKLRSEWETYRGEHGWPMLRLFAAGLVEMWCREMFGSERAMDAGERVCA
jgi:asparagine synthase (glutamine-hydrolysing)